MVAMVTVVVVVETILLVSSDNDRVPTRRTF